MATRDDVRSRFQAVASVLGAFGSILGVVIAARTLGYAAAFAVAGIVLVILGMLTWPRAEKPRLWVPGQEESRGKSRRPWMLLGGGVAMALVAGLMMLRPVAAREGHHLQPTYLWLRTDDPWPEDWSVRLLRTAVFEEFRALQNDVAYELRTRIHTFPDADRSPERARAHLEQRGVRLPDSEFDPDSWDLCPLTEDLYGQLVAGLGWRSELAEKAFAAGQETCGAVDVGLGGGCGYDEATFEWYPPSLDLLVLDFENKSDEAVAELRIDWVERLPPDPEYIRPELPSSPVEGRPAGSDRVRILRPREHVSIPVAIGMRTILDELGGGGPALKVLEQGDFSEDVERYWMFGLEVDQRRLFVGSFATEFVVSYRMEEDSFETLAHAYDPDQTYFLEDGFEAGSCPHLWVSSSGRMLEVGEILGERLGVPGWDYVALPARADAIELRNPQGEEARIEGIWRRGSRGGWTRLAGTSYPIVLGPGESLALGLEGQPGLGEALSLAFFGSYRKLTPRLLQSGGASHPDSRRK